MDELKIETPMMRGIVGRAVTRYLKKKGIDIDVSINSINGETSTKEDTVSVRADVVVTVTKNQIIKLLS